MKGFPIWPISYGVFPAVTHIGCASGSSHGISWNQKNGHKQHLLFMWSYWHSESGQVPICWAILCCFFPEALAKRFCWRPLLPPSPALPFCTQHHAATSLPTVKDWWISNVIWVAWKFHPVYRDIAVPHRIYAGPMLKNRLVGPKIGTYQLPVI